MKTLIALAAASTALVAVPALAQSYNFSFTGSTPTSTPISASGTFTVTGSTITGISGQYNGATIDQLYAPGTVVDSVNDKIDNVFSSTAPYLTGNGVGFGIVGNNLLYNLYSTGANSYALYIATYPSTGSTAGSTNNTVSTFTVSRATGAVPEPATWAMMLVGFGAVGGALRRRSKVATTVRYA
ncbi:PEPxxWA-CTERM sorting domain-containing protein [Sphingomonas panacisoli]|uniref:PEPxxWA-CTERM sorting domain-containing protein n=1 Tax=Sphingomonas panacisoli TaxID=1813879 RepID=UPI001F01BAE5|nr:PEPxxWA-CTERM sorting domain-containing protein [Sphingomonas panacisoli]